MHVLGHLSRVVALDEEREFAREVRGGDGSVRADDWFALVIYEGFLGFRRRLYDDAGRDGEEGCGVRRELEDEPMFRSVSAVRACG